MGRAAGGDRVIRVASRRGVAAACAVGLYGGRGAVTLLALLAQAGHLPTVPM
jgi:hypothetical protein